MAFKPIKSYLVGDVIFNEKPIVHVVDSNQKSLKCDFCLKLNQSLKRCSKCSKMYYCDRECQRKDWHSHKNECKIYAQYYDKCLNDFFMRLLMRLWLLVKIDKSLLAKKYQLFNGNYRCLNDLESHQKEIESDQNRMNQFNKLCQNFTICGIEYSTEELFKLYGQLLINIYSIVIHDMIYENIKSGFGLYICSSIFDHSCSPNACIVSSGLNLQIRAIKEIAKNEEIFVHYIPLDMNKTERKAKLKSQYYFECNCNKCKSDEDNRIDYQKFKSLQKQLHQNIISDSSSTEQNSSMIDQFLSTSEQIYGSIHPELAAIMMIVMQYILMSPEINYSPQFISQFIKRTGEVIKLSFGCEHKFYQMYQLLHSIKNISNE